MLRVLDLFSGIGGFSLGLERTGGFKTVAFCEIESFPRKVLAKHWPEVPCYHDVRELTAERLAADGIGIDVICGGFPCQDISVAGRGAGMAGERSGLWSEFARLIGELQPRYAIVENVSALLSRGLADVLGDLASLGYDAEWHCIPASAVGAPHRRDRVWIIAHAISGELRHESGRRNGASWAGQAQPPDDGEQGAMADAEGIGCSIWSDSKRKGPENKQNWNDELRSQSCGRSEDVANADRPERRQDDAPRRSVQREDGLSQGQESAGRSKSSGEDVPDARSTGLQASRAQPYGTDGIVRRRMLTSSDWWLTEPNVGRVANGVPSRVDRLKGLGNAVVPQIPELIGRAILAAGT
jgi:DNA (cytosine-5)-methyltransferase 1